MKRRDVLLCLGPLAAIAAGCRSGSDASASADKPKPIDEATPVDPAFTSCAA